MSQQETARGQDEKLNKKKMRFFGIPAIMPFIKPYGGKIVIMVLFGCISSLFDSIFPLFNRYALNHYVLEHTLDTLGIFIFLYILILAVQSLGNFYSCWLCGKLELEVGRDAKNAAFTHLQTLSFAYYNTNNVGYLHARVMSDTDRIGTLVSWHLMQFVWNFAYLVCVFAVMLKIDLKLTLYLMLLLPVGAVLIAYFQKHLVALNRKIREINSTITGNFNEGIAGARSVRTLVVEGKMQENFEKDTALMRKTSIHATHYSALFSSTVTMLSSVALSLVLWKGGRLNMAGLMQIGTLSVFMSYALNMLEPVQGIIETISQLIAVQVNIERLDTLLSTRSDVEDRPEVVEKYGDAFKPKKENWEKLKGEVEFRDVSFMYPDGNEWVLEHFNLHIPQGTNVAIVGETGAGKSTLVNLVCRFYEPTKGTVLIDGKDVRDRSQLWLHSNIGYVLQTPHLFSGSIRENMRYGNPDATDEEIIAALHTVHADDLLHKLDKGLDAEVGEGGDLLSTGEKQLLSFARAILADPGILVLDEATSSIDTETEKAIQDAITALISGRTSFMIAHRLSTVVDADVILVVSDGKIVEQGTHRELMQAGGFYYRLYTRQYEETMTEGILS